MRPARVIVVLAALFAVLACVTPSASAAAGDPATVTRDQVLSASPTDNDPVSCTVTRYIYLAHGTYAWYQIILSDKPDHPVFGGGERAPITLAAGHYYWSSCLEPENGQYYQLSTISPAGSGAVAQLAWTYVTKTYKFTTERYTWGDTLVLCSHTQQC